MTTLENPLYLHCAQCIREDQPQSVEVAVDGVKLQVWCKTHQRSVATLTLNEPLNATCSGEHHGE